MVRSGEAAGNLDAVLVRLADFLDAQNALRAKVSGALTYPIIMMVLGAVVMGVLMVVVVPQDHHGVRGSRARRCPGTRELLIFVSETASAATGGSLIVLGMLAYCRVPALGAHAARAGRSLDRLTLQAAG